MTAPRLAGVVKWFNDAKGYGFIAPDGADKDVFVHYSGILGKGHKKLDDGDLVDFEIAQTENGPACVNVSKRAPVAA